MSIRKVEAIDLWAGAAVSGEPTLTLYHSEDPVADGWMVLIHPGGGYGFVSDREGLPIAEFFCGLGYPAAVLKYRIAPHGFPAPYADAARAARVLRGRLAGCGVAADRLASMGFSAGGHLAALVATQPELVADPLDELAGSVSARPDRLILAYPVISMVEEFHAGSAENLLGAEASEARRAEFSLDRQVTADCPPTFLFHAADDEPVPVSNSVRFAQACWRAGVDAELHVFPRGGHGDGFAHSAATGFRWRRQVADWLAG